MAKNSTLSFVFFILRFIFFIFSITIFVTAGTIAIHELGHFIAAKLSKCDYNSIVFSLKSLPSTEIQCLENSNFDIGWIAFSGLFFTSIVSGLLFISVKIKGMMKYFALIVFSIGVIASSYDLIMISLNPINIIILNIFSYLLFSFSLIQLIIYYFNKECDY